MGVERLQLQRQADQPLRQRVVQLPGEALPLRGERELLQLAGLDDEAPVGRVERVEGRPRLLVRAGEAVEDRAEPGRKDRNRRGIAR